MTRQEREYLADNSDVTNALGIIDAYLSKPRLAASVTAVAEATVTVRNAHDDLLKDCKRESLDSIERMYAGIEAHAAEMDVKLDEIGHRKAERRSAAHDAQLLTELDALQTRLAKDQTDLFARIDEEHEKALRPRPANTSVTMTDKTSASVTGTPKSAGPQRRPKRLDRNQVFLPGLLSSEADVDAYLAKARGLLIQALKDNDQVRLG